MSRKSKSVLKGVLVTLAILLLGVAVTAALTNGFKTSNPYGWLENFDRMKKNQEITGFEVCKDFDVDFDKLVKNVKAVEDKDSGTKTYAIVTTENENVYINVVETIADSKSSYSLNVNGQSVCTSADGFNDSAIEAIKSFDACKITDVKNAGRLAHYIGGTYTKADEAVAEATAKYEVMKAGQTISGFEWNFENFNVNELIQGIESISGDGCLIYPIVVLDNEHDDLQICVYKVSEGIIEENSPEVTYLLLNEAVVWSSDTSVVPLETDLSSVESFTPVTIKTVYNAEILAKYVGAKS